MYEHRTSDWKQIDETLRRLARDKGAYDFEEGRWLLAGLRSGVHLRLGFATFAEYVERLFGYKPRFTAERLRVAEALEDLPVASAALEGGDVCWSAVREVSRVATPETEAAWLASFARPGPRSSATPGIRSTTTRRCARFWADRPTRAGPRIRSV